MDRPRKMLPSASTRTAGVFCGTNRAPNKAKNRRKRWAQKNGRAQLPFYSLIPLALVEKYSRNRPRFPAERRFLAQSEHVLHVVEARLLPGDELRRPHRALRIVRPRARAVRDLDALPGSGEVHRVVADDVAAARDGEPDAAGLALAGLPV